MAGVEHSLGEWRRSLARSGVLSEEDLDELETHVRDTIEDLAPGGLSQEEALLVALRRVGDPSLLAMEFEKVRPGLAWARRFYWMIAGVLTFGLLWQGAKLLIYSSALGASTVGLSPAAGAGAAAVLALGGVAAVMIRSTGRPGGRLARGLQGAARWLSKRPFLCGVGILAATGAASLGANLTFARFVRFPTEAGSLSQALFDVALVASASPLVAALGLFLLARRLSRGAEPEAR
jgi:hypothetical protein